ncbi:hypothetical protein [Listeria seeligeri]|uniref:hypothetical protein n=1 Tax=Listeria seeligeri TaxID=1640 RepID=UPI001628F20B|nr:hypothetical protein [Listeria seeligeri]MBC1851163.1 hypothetical protein [Listeria seeligeri]MBC1929352.1 hypothetical protein [Listeria seeligeri]MBF2370260.1 hypothetical protein [Listeria seeligeri]MBF2390457.1 hypothetical protein [Listeria seeligeri]
MIKYKIVDGTTIEGSVDEVLAFLTQMAVSTIYSSDDELEIYGQTFEKVQGAARQGDFIIYEEAPYSFLTSNVPYLVKSFDDDENSVIITDDDGDVYNTYCDNFNIYRLKGKE